MGNVESQNGDIYGDVSGRLSRKNSSRSLRVSNKQPIVRRPRHYSSAKQEHRNSETSTRSSSTPSIPQSLAESSLEPFNAIDAFGDWTQRVPMTMRPDSYQNDDDPLATPTPETSEADTVPHDGGEDSIGEGEEDLEEVQYLERMSEGTREPGSFKKKRSKSADMWREDSLEFSLSDLSQEHLTSTEEIIDGGEEEEEEEQFTHPRGNAGETGSAERASSLDHLCSQQSPGLRGQRSRYTKTKREEECDRDVDGDGEEGLMSPGEEDGGLYGAFTLPCRRSHCLSEGLAGLGMPAAPCPAFQGRRAKTTQDISGVLGEGSEYGDSGIDGVAAEIDGDGELLSRRCKAMSASFSVYSATEGRGGEGGRGGVYENFRKELDNQAWTQRGRDCMEESDERSSGTLSSAYPSDSVIGCAQGTVRKAGALAVKNFLVHKKNKKVELATRRKWKHYWVSLRGCTLFLYESDCRSGIDHNSVPKHALWVENSIVQAVPEHPKKDFVFCLSNSVGDAFLFQTSGQTELENWITAIHSACAAALARQHHREDTVRLLRTEIRKLEQKIDMDEKMKKMGDMQLSTITGARNQTVRRIFICSASMSRFGPQGARYKRINPEMPKVSSTGCDVGHPKRMEVITQTQTRDTCDCYFSLYIVKFKSFWPTQVSARTESNIRKRNQAMPRTFSKRRSRFSSLWGLDTTSKRKTTGHPSINQVFVDKMEPAKKPLGSMFEDSASEKSKEKEGSVKSLPQQTADSDIWVPEYLTPSWVCLPNNQPVLAVIQPGDTALDVLNATCKTHKLDPSSHYLRMKVWNGGQMLLYVPKVEEDISDVLYKEIEICTKDTKMIWFDKVESHTIGYGFSVEVVEEDGTQQLHITAVKPDSLASAKGLKIGDEILLLNGKPASALCMDDLRAAFVSSALSLSISTLPELHPRASCSVPPRRSDWEQDPTTDIFSQNQVHSLTSWRYISAEKTHPNFPQSPHCSRGEEGGKRGKSTEQATAFCRSLHDMNSLECPMSSSSSSSSSSLSPSPVSALPPTPGPAAQRQLSHADKLRKVINELLETERTYVKDLSCLIECYLTPLQKESFLTQDELDILFGNLGEMVEFQVEFLRTLEDGIKLVPDLDRLERVEQFKKVLFSLGGSFLYYADRFKIYSAFCASHTKVPKVLAKAKTDSDFKTFLAERNPRQQHSSTLESYLIKPIQRVLKYPLLLKELYCLTDPDSEEHYHLDVATKAMNKVASHINEMQKLHEEYGAVFDQLINEQTAMKKEVADLSMGDLLLHCTVAWINPPASLVKSKKEPHLAAFVFKTAVVFVYKDSSKHKKKIGASHRASVADEKDPFRFRHMIATDSLQVRTLASTSNSEGMAVCEIIHTRSESEGRPERTFQLCCSSPDTKKDFLKAVQSILREKQRRQLLKTESLPPSQQYVPFGGKRLSALKGARPGMNRAASAPSRTLGRRKLVRNRFTIDTDIIFHGNNNPQKLQGEDTDRWVEEQFDLRCYEEQGPGVDMGQVKETDILSDDDEYCKSVRAASAEPADLDGRMERLDVRGGEKGNGQGEAGGDATEEVDHKIAAGDSDSGVAFSSCDVIWVRRDDFVNSCNSDV
uniref:TIAM Rac1 associated GEF 1 n=1 Tax=Tetraodon nigroviridis TaxID=99883 RepID=H3CX54_TETNG